jgi:hypothetical protein
MILLTIKGPLWLSGHIRIFASDKYIKPVGLSPQLVKLQVYSA